MADITAALSRIEDGVAALVDELVADSPGEDLLNAVALGVKAEQLAALRHGRQGGNATYVWRKYLSVAVSQLATVQVRSAAQMIGGYGLPPRRRNSASPVELPDGPEPSSGVGPDLLPLDAGGG